MPHNQKILEALNMPCLVLKPLKNDFRIIEANQAFLEMTRSQGEPLPGRSFTEVLSDLTRHDGSDYACFFPALKEVLRTGKVNTIKCFRTNWVAQEETGQYWSVRSTPIFDKEGQLDVVAMSFTDITEAIRIKKENALEMVWSQQGYRHFVEANSDGLYSLDRSGRFTSANEGLAKITGVPVAQLLEMGFQGFCHPGHRDLIESHFQKAIAGESTVFEALFVVRDQREVLLEINLVPIIMDNVVRGVYGISKDKTQLLEVQNVVIRKDNFLKANASFIGGLFEKDLDREMLERSFATIGEAMEVDRMYYYLNHLNEEGKQVVSIRLEWTSGSASKNMEDPFMKNMDLKSFLEMMPLKADEAFTLVVREIQNDFLRELFVKKGVKSTLVLPIYVKNGLHGFVGFDDCRTERMWQDEEIDFLKGLTRNMTTILEKRAAEEEVKLNKSALIRSEQKFKALVQEGSDMIAILDLKGNYLFVSESRYPILGFRPEEILGQSAANHIHPDDVGYVINEFRLLKTRKQAKVSHRMKTKKGEWRWLESTITNLIDDPAIGGIVTNSRDITENRQALERIQKQNEILKDIAWEQSHLFRAPVARIQGLINVILAEGKVEPEQMEFIRYLEASAKELDGIIHDIVHKSELVGNIR